MSSHTRRLNNFSRCAAEESNADGTPGPAPKSAASGQQRSKSGRGGPPLPRPYLPTMVPLSSHSRKQWGQLREILGGDEKPGVCCQTQFNRPPSSGGVVSNTDVNAIETVGRLLHTNSLHPKEKASTLLHGRDMPAASPVCSWRICVMEQTPGARILPPWKIARPPRQPLHTAYSRTAHFCICDCTPPTWPPHTPNCRDGARVRFAQ